MNNIKLVDLIEYSKFMKNIVKNCCDIKKLSVKKIIVEIRII